MSKHSPFAQLFLQMILVTMIGMAILSTAYPVQARTTIKHPVHKTTPKAPASINTNPKTTLTFSAHRFWLTVKNIKTITYTIEYTRTSANGPTLEGMQGGGKAKKGIFSARLYAGTQSTKYFIPHNVKSGSINVKATDLQGNPYLYKASFVIKRGRLVITQ